MWGVGEVWDNDVVLHTVVWVGSRGGRVRRHPFIHRRHPPPPCSHPFPHRCTSDSSLMPRNRKTWASWNLIGRSDAKDTAAVCVTYYVNRLQV